ncbi:MAG: hypothetical protein J6N76_08065 [Lachnospiraceae bacterium]|nr:hypothetical protein [Lachnospiraceae bacterium]
MKKRTVALLIISIMITGLTGCGTKAPASAEEEPVEKAMPAEAAETMETAEAETEDDTDGSDEVKNNTSESEEVSTETDEKPVDDSWKQVYLDYLQNTLPGEVSDELEGWSFGFIYVNDDDIPELVASSGYEAGGNVIVTPVDGKASELWTSRLNFYYIERGNVIDNCDGNMGYYYDNIYEIGDKGFEEVFSGSYNMLLNEDETDYSEEFEYFINDESTTKDEYDAAVEKYIPYDKRINWTTGSYLENMTDYLSGNGAADYKAAYTDIINNSEDVVNDGLYKFALVEREGRDPLLLGVGDEKFRFFSYDNGLTGVLPSWYFSESSEIVMVYKPVGTIENLTSYESSSYTLINYYDVKDGSVVGRYMVQDAVMDENGEYVMDSSGENVSEYTINGYKTDKATYVKAASALDGVYFEQLAPANASYTYMEYFDKDEMLDKLK